MMNFLLTLPTVLERARQLFASVEVVSRRPDKSVHRYTYGEFYRRARKLASGLRRAGMRPGHRVATFMWNHEAHLEAYFGIPCAGGVLHTLNLRLHPDDLAFIATHASDQFAIVDDVLLPLFEKFQARAGFEKVFVVSQSGKPVPDGYESYESLIALGDENEPLATPDENDALGMCYTSGTTGKPKGVVYSHRSTVLHSFAAMLADGLALSGRDTVLPVVPMFHANAWGIPFAAVMAGTKLVFPGPHLDADNLLDLFERERVNLAAGVPTVWMAILDALDKSPSRFQLVPGLRMVVGGSAAPESMIRAFDRHGLRVIHAWGMTETSPLGSVAWVRPSVRAGGEDAEYAARAKQGIPAPFVEMRAVGDTGEVPWDGKTPGELEVRGPWVAAEYYKNEAEDEKWTPDGWFRTGDVVTLDPDGYMKITDRTKDLIKSGGEWISSVDLENALMGHPGIREAAVIAVPHPKWTERPLAVVVRRQGSAVSAEELRTFLATKFAKFWVPEAYAFVDAIPRTSAGKFLKSALREQYKGWDWEGQ
ncbi:MAG: long-chain fatty acid--CoA ligase [Deltaproteobacteria bacterium]